MSTTGFRKGCLCPSLRILVRAPQNPRSAESSAAAGKYAEAAAYAPPRFTLLKETMGVKIAVAGAGIYGATTAIRLAEQGHDVHLFDPLGILRAASAINQYRIHSGYHYPRSPETITETLEARAEFIGAFAPAVVRNSRHYYAILTKGSQTPPDLFERVMSQHSLICRPCHPDWMNFDFIDRCYEVDEQLYDPAILRNLVESRIKSLAIPFEHCEFRQEMRPDYDFVVWAAYGLGPSRGLFKIA